MKKRDKKSILIALRVDQETAQALEDYAINNEVSRSQVIRRAIKKLLGL